LATLAKGLIGFLVPGAVIFGWLLVFNQWHRLRPFYLPSGTFVFLAIAAPWHLLVAQRNPGWAQFYFVHEHWQRFTTTVHSRHEPWWFFVPIVVLGLFPWTGCLWSALCSALAGGWAKRKQNADAWFLATWAGFVFVFFSKSQSKLVPYILPVFPPLALFIGQWLGKVWREEAAPRLRPAAIVFGVTAGVLGIAIAVVLLRPSIIGDRAQLQALRPSGLVAAAALICGAIMVPWNCARGRLRSTLVALAASVGSLYLVLADAHENIARPGTKELALYIKTHAAPQDAVYHYHDYFQDFSFYAERYAGTIASDSELEIALDPAARTSGLFLSEAEFRETWSGPKRLWVIARKKSVGSLFADPSFHCHLLAESRGHLLFSNQP
jgi:4-amino-4-deoxy-L-arabinose transferase-like glycosyltransferase